MLLLLLMMMLYYLTYNFSQLRDCNLSALQKAKLLNNSADNFINTGFIICVVSWVWANVLAIQTKCSFWVFMPFLFTVIVACLMSWQAETIFIFNKQNGLWKGGFSLSYFLGIVIIFTAAAILGINYLIIKRFLK